MYEFPSETHHGLCSVFGFRYAHTCGQLRLVEPISCGLALGMDGRHDARLGHPHACCGRRSVDLCAWLLGILCGVIVIVAAVMLYVNPRQDLLWGALVIAFSVISAASWMGSLGLGLVTGLIGGILALLWKPEETKRI